MKKMSQEKVGQLTHLNYDHIGWYKQGNSKSFTDKLKKSLRKFSE
ncbi:hypothetical protein LEP1GSC107_4700 [Leptospira interrogans serovar Grippotyphosa str. UI 12769]|nr:hypothetical protein [Leptospira interrogans]EJO77547.1 hypothetical protein LEP1GSC045_2212 [Leptospira interrogans serovar Pomona str. Kennewicki LC82-25]EKN86996.1 hypothetical protein LEP1GSC027_0243 [Leptospira interrogans str. 2002000624]EKQ48549.1 hypothetical protein LEP1GSC026_2788 [Leptospira interrogans str. 2002000623]EKR46459.1 hypothetical protein LEP1GSC097_4675 [Leptospira interrogans serovar Grippotyphosa str. UI 08368]EMJ37165.1 hypothetical protein LEP1GSC079_0149 [Leptos